MLHNAFMNLRQFFKNLNVLWALLHAQAAGHTLLCIGFAQLLILFHRIEPGSLALEAVINCKDFGNGDSLGTDIAVVAGSTGDQNLLAQDLTGCLNFVQFFLRKHTGMGICRNRHILLHLAGFIHTA